MDENPEKKRTYRRNQEVGGGRTLRVELVGELSEDERNFLEGMGYFISGTLCKDDPEFIRMVSARITELILKVSLERGGGNDGGQREFEN